MEEKTRLLIVEDENGVKAEVNGSPSDVMCLVKEALKAGNKALQKCPCIDAKDAQNLIDEVIEDYQTEVKYGEEAAIVRRILQIAKHI